jgi:hypothetical protein
MVRAIVIAGVIAIQALGQTPGQPPAGGSISGRVKNSVNGAGVGGAAVECVYSQLPIGDRLR